MLLATMRANLLACVLGLLAAILLIIAIIQTIQINGIFWIDGLKDKLEDCARDRNELRDIAKQKNEQRETTKDNIQKVERNEREAAPIVKIIREAPIPPNCQTPGLDVLRNEI